MGIVNEVIGADAWAAARNRISCNTVYVMESGLPVLDECMLRMEQSLKNCAEVGGVGFLSQMGKIEKLAEDVEALTPYIYELPNEIADMVDDPFYSKVNIMMDTFTTIDANKVNTPNMLRRTGNKGMECGGEIVYYESMTQELDDLSLGDFLGFDLTKPTAAYGWIERQEISEFAEMFRDKLGDYSLDTDYAAIAKGIFPEEFPYSREVSFWLVLLDNLSDILIIPKIIDASLGYDFITGDNLTEQEKNSRALSAMADILLGLVGGAETVSAANGSTKLLLKLLLVDLIKDSAGTVVYTVSDELGAPPLVSELLSFLTGLAVDKSLSDMLFDADGNINQAKLKELKEEYAEQLDIMSDRYGISREDLISLRTKKALTGEEIALLEELNTRMRVSQLPVHLQPPEGFDYRSLEDVQKYHLQLSTQGDGANGFTVLGSFDGGGETSYVKVAENLKANYYSLGSDWNVINEVMGEDYMWKLNKSFIDQQLARNHTLVLSHNPCGKMSPGFAKEVKYIESLGYAFEKVKEANLWMVIKK